MAPQKTCGSMKGIFSFLSSVGACIALRKILSATTFQKKKERVKKKDDDHEFTLASSVPFQMSASRRKEPQVGMRNTEKFNTQL